VRYCLTLQNPVKCRSMCIYRGYGVCGSSLLLQRLGKPLKQRVSSSLESEAPLTLKHFKELK